MNLSAVCVAEKLAVEEEMIAVQVRFAFGDLFAIASDTGYFQAHERALTATANP